MSPWHKTLVPIRSFVGGAGEHIEFIRYVGNVPTVEDCSINIINIIKHGGHFGD